MKTSSTQKIKTGIFILAAFGVLALTIFLIGNQKNMFSSTFPAHANFSNVSGLQLGNFVRFAGIDVGTVNAITIKNDTTVRVDFVLQKNVKPFIKADSRASIGSDGLMGDKLVQIAPGTDSAGPLLNGELIAVNPMDMDKMMAKLGGIANDAQTITSNLAGIIYKVNNGSGSLGKLLNSNDLANNLESTVKTTYQTENTINKAASGVSDNMDAAKHSFLFRGYFKKKEKQRIADSIKNANKNDSAAAKHGSKN
jgi:phospholipid/cholesterol/gamma-HCH transport system substrate-binding protein